MARSAPHPAATASTVLAVEGTRFTLNGDPTFLLGFSYYGALGAPEPRIWRDIHTFRDHGFNWLRVWATWANNDIDASAFDSDGAPRSAYLDRLKWLVRVCDRSGIVVDVTFARGEPSPRGGRLTSFPAHRRAVESVVQALKTHPNWYLDLANERDVHDDRYVDVAELKELRQLVRSLDPDRLVTASFGGHDLSPDDVRDLLLEVGADFLAPHRPRHPQSPAETEPETRKLLNLCKELGRPVPVHYQEPFRRGYTSWEPDANDFLADLRGAVRGGAAGWCFHNGSQRTDTDLKPSRSFDLRDMGLWIQLDSAEKEVVERARKTVRENRSETVR